MSKKPKRSVIRNFKRGLLDYKINNSIYSVFAKYYDIIMDDIDYELWYRYIIDICNKFGIKIRRVMDMACGTGTTLWYFVREGYKCSALDMSPYMIDKAKTKLSNKTYDIDFIISDMSKYKSENKYDLIYSFNDSVNYLNKLESLSNFLYTAYDLLETGGILIFDASTEYNIITNFSSPIYEEYKNIAFLWKNFYNEDTRIVISELDFLIFESLEVIREKHIQRIHSINEILREAKTVGFSNINYFDGFTFNQPHKRSEIIHFVLKK